MRKLIDLMRGCALLGLAAACTSTNPTPGSDAGSSSSSPPSPSGGQDGSGSPAVVNGCTSFTDMTASGATINGPMDFNPVQFSPNCVQIKSGQSVTWNVDFAAHPLAASGGTTPSPIETTSSGTTVTFSFANAGTYGYHCLAHPTIMFGAVLVTP